MTRFTDIKDDLASSAKFWSYRVVVGLLTLVAWAVATLTAICLSPGYRLEVAIFCAGIVPLPLFLCVNSYLNRLSRQRFGHGVHYRSHPLFLLIPIAIFSAVLLVEMMENAGRFDWFRQAFGLESYWGCSFPGS